MAFAPVAAPAAAAAPAGKAAKGATTAAGALAGSMGDAANSVIAPAFSTIMSDPLSFTQKLGLSVVSGGLGAVGDIMKEHAAGSQARKFKQTPANAQSSVNAASQAPGLSALNSPQTAGQSQLQGLQQNVQQMISQAGSQQLKASRFGAGAF